MLTTLSAKSGLLSSFSMLWLLLAIGLAFQSSTLAQNALPITGTVVTDDGQPIAGVMVQGELWKSCCPAQQDSATSDEKGEFRLEHGGPVIHFLKDGLQPETIGGAVYQQAPPDEASVFDRIINSICTVPYPSQ